MTSDQIIPLVRLKNRGTAFNQRTFLLLRSAVIFSGIYGFVNTLFLTVILGPESLILENFHLFNLLVMGMLTLFYWWIGLLSYIIEDKTNSMNNGILVTLTFLIGLHGSGRFFSRALNPWIWSPIEDYPLFENLMTGVWNPADVVTLAIRAAAIVFLLTLVGKYIFKKKDFLSHEK
jgi:hypothetical protein